MLDVDETLVTELEAFAREFGAVEGAQPPNGEREEEAEAGKENAGGPPEARSRARLAWPPFQAPQALADAGGARYRRHHLCHSAAAQC